MTTNSTLGNSTIGRRLQDGFLPVGVAIVFVAIVIRNNGIYPIVFSDEYVYSTFSRLAPLAKSWFPDYLYLTIFGVTNICGDGFLACARILNALFFVAATPFIYFTARRVCTRGIASAIALLALVGPINTYTAYYMPESLYFFSFWLLTWYVLRLDNSAGSRAWSLAGIILGLLALIKPHALLFLPAIVGYVLYNSRKKEGRWVLQAIRNAGTLVVLTFLTKLLIGYLLAGKAGLTFFGPCYTAVASSTTTSAQRCLELIALSAESVKGHALAICLMFSVPVVLAITASLNSVFSKAEARSDQKISFYALVVLVNLILVAGLFTASVANVGPYETNARLHMRYYNFALPLLLVIAASQLSLPSIASARKWRALAAFPIGLAIVYAAYTRLAPFTPSLVDSPELRGFTYQLTVFYVLSGISFFALALWVYSARAGAQMFVYVFMPLAVVFSSVYVSRELRLQLAPNVFDRASICAKQCLSKEELSKVVVVGSDPSGLFRSLFHLDNPDASFEMIPNGSACNLTKLPVGKEWILVIGDHALPKNACVELPMNGFTLAHIRSANAIDFKKSAWPGVIVSAQGLCSAEPWGTWSSGSAVTLEWAMPLPENFTVHLVAQAFGPNVGKEFAAHVGDSVVRFRLGAPPEERVLEFSNPKRSKTIKIDVPSPIAPKELGLNGDDRRVGIGLVELRIIPL